MGNIVEEGANVINTLVGGIAPHIGSWFGRLIGNGKAEQKTNEQIMSQQHEYNKELMNLQGDVNSLLQEKAYQQQKALNRTQYQTALKDISASGLNPNSVIGGSFSAPSTNPASGASIGLGSQTAIPYRDLNNVSPSDMVNGIMQSGQLRLLKAQARSIEIDNQRAADEDNFFRAGSATVMIDPDTGAEIEDYGTWSSSHPGQSPEVVILPKFISKGSYNAYMQRMEAFAKKPESFARSSKAKLENAVKTAQGAHKEVMQALVHMPQKEYMKLLKEISVLAKEADLKVTQNGLVASDKALKDWELEANKSTTVAGLLDAIKSPDMGVGDKLIVLLGVILSYAMRR